MREIYDMPSNDLKLWKAGDELILEVKGEIIKLSGMESESLIETLTKLNKTMKVKSE